MVGRQLGDDAWTSLQTLWREELWLPAGLPVALVVYALWVGLTGAAIGFLADAVAGQFAFDPWTTSTTLTVALVGVLWVLGPAAVATVLVTQSVLNFNDNLRHGYRLRYPLLLLSPPAVVLAIGARLVAGGGEATLPALAVAIAGALWLLVRTLAYSYRVFSLSFPIVVQALVFVTSAVVAVTALVGGAIGIGREALVSDVLAGLAGQTGVAQIATLHTGTVAVTGVAVPVLAAAVVAVPVVLSAGYVTLQVPWSVLIRLWRPSVRRPELRTGQRYPPFARPTTDSVPDRLRSLAGLSAGYRPGADSTAGDGSSQTGAAESATAPSGAGSASAGTAGSSPDAGGVAGGTPGRASSTDGGPTASGHEPAASGETAGGNGTGPSGASTTDGRAAEAGADDATADTSAGADAVSNTRVFTAPDDASLDATGTCPACAQAVDVTVDACPNCGEPIDGV